MDARLTHLLEQAGGHLSRIAPTLRAYYHALTTGEDAIPPAQAIELVRDLQRRMIGEGGDDAGA